MAIIKIDELRPTGAELFQDSESFLNELSDSEMSIFGGKDKDSDPTVLSIDTYSISIYSESVITNYYDVDIKIKVKNK
ncbi:hypothetical protein [Brasilonema sp. UFV-L1]|uniref:hypothetical protein n=1 Tax=Brasilonema sp. UFV-L1 TaxID=2234130 RepID=UPI00145DB996|nr:hypothetical protein [Brasilonema sp. UFV-L1]NMG08704.1 hypothetical protein [Brasilonema sp. UFV-L1]